MKTLIPELDDYDLWCTRTALKKDQLDAYLNICDHLKQLAPLYVLQPQGYKIKSHAIAMYIFYELFHSFSHKHGFTNYKLFNRMFKEIYGCTPREVRQDH